jgi:hypothetical protein
MSGDEFRRRYAAGELEPDDDHVLGVALAGGTRVQEQPSSVPPLGRAGPAQPGKVTS